MALALNRGIPIVLSLLGALAGCASDGIAPARPETPISAAKPSARPAFKVGDVLGKSADAVDRLFGSPALVRREGDGEFRRYGLKTCSVIVIFFPDERAERTAGFIDSAAKTSGEGKPDLGACLAAG